MTARNAALTLLALAAAALPVASAQAAPPPPAPAWQLSLVSLPTNFAPGSVGSEVSPPGYYISATNVGGAPTSAPTTITTVLPEGVSPLAPVASGPCTRSGQVVTCTKPDTVYPGRLTLVTIPVEVSPFAPVASTLAAEATVSSAGSSTVSTTYSTEINPQPPSFGFLPGNAGMQSLFTNADGTPAVQAGSHPDQLSLNFGFTSEHLPGWSLTGAGHLRDLTTNLPRGVVVNPNATKVRCTEAELITDKLVGCPDASQIGTVVVRTEASGPQLVTSPVYNMVPPPGAAAEIAFDAVNVGIYVHLAGRVRSDGDYGLTADATDILARGLNPVIASQAMLWGDPSGQSHDEIRGNCRNNPGGSCPVARQRTPFLTMPSACSGPLTTAASADSWEEPNPPAGPQASAQSTDTPGNPVGVSGCSILEFKPTLTLRPDTAAAESPAGIDVNLHVPQNEDREDLATSNVKDVTVSFPAGMALNPAAADGLGACSPAQIGMITGVGQTPPRFSTDRPRCPESSKIGTVEVKTPLLDHSLPGAVYVAQPFQNPFQTLLGAYVVIDSPEDGLVAKLAGKTVADPHSGQLTVSFTENPELPVEDFKVHLFGGSRAALRTPATCGTYTTTSLQAPWSGNPPVKTTDSFKVSQGSSGRPCVTSEAQMPSTPGFEAGTQAPIAGAYSPFLGRLQRSDGEQQLKALDMTLPAGLTGKLAGIQTCSEGAIAAAAQKSGAAELASPSCPAGSQIGEVKVGAGAGPAPYYTTGKIYLAGPYKGGPISAAVITPAVAGPFDLGTVVIRAITKINPATAVLSVQSEDAPHILQGIPLEIRDIRIALDRSQFTLNPTNCDAKAITGQAISLTGSITPLAERFQVGGCKGLDYEPKLAIRLFGKTGRGAHPRLRAVLQAKPGEANTARASVALPRSEFLENAHIGTVCTRVQFAADNCPAKAIYGHATAITPLLDEPLEGPVYLRSSSNKLPDMVAALRGPATRPIKVELAGRIDSVNGGIRSTFDFVPDQPVTKFVLNMFGGRKGLIVNSRNLCRATYRATAKFDGQNGKAHDFNPVMKNSCKKKGKGKKGKARARS